MIPTQKHLDVQLKEFNMKIRQILIYAVIFSFVIFIQPQYTQPANIKIDDCPNARVCYAIRMAIPLHNHMNEDNYQYVVDVIKNI